LDQRATEINTLQNSIQQVGFYNNANQFSQSFGQLSAFVDQIQSYSAEVAKYAEQLSQTPQNP
jgi:methyl-accepting chemotaxis protein